MTKRVDSDMDMEEFADEVRFERMNQNLTRRRKFKLRDTAKKQDTYRRTAARNADEIE